MKLIPKEVIPPENETPLQLRIREAEEHGWVFNWTDAGCHITPPTGWHAWVDSAHEALDDAGVP